VADNALEVLPAGLAGLASLKLLTVYGNRLRALAQELIRMPSLQGAPDRNHKFDKNLSKYAPASWNCRPVVRGQPQGRLRHC